MPGESREVTIPVSSREEAMVLFGPGDRNLKLLRDRLGIRIAARNSRVRLFGEDPALEQAAGILHRVLDRVRSGGRPSADWLEKELRFLGEDGTSADRARSAAAVAETSGDLAPEGAREEPREGPMMDDDPGGPAADGGREASAGSGAAPAGFGRRKLSAEEVALATRIARSPGQKAYLESILRNEIVFCTGPAGTGKTFLAVRMAVHFLRAGELRRLVLCRPAIEAGEKLGFLPGDFQAKINPYLRPLYDALNDILDYDQVKRYIDREIIEIIPLAYMRGRTLNQAFIILDEGQNVTISQMKMFLTRMGAGSRIVVNGDVTQIDLPEGQPSGMIHASRVVRDIDGIGWIRMQKPDIVRHPLVQRIVEAYESGPHR